MFATDGRNAKGTHKWQTKLPSHIDLCAPVLIILIVIFDFGCCPISSCLKGTMRPEWNETSLCTFVKSQHPTSASAPAARSVDSQSRCLHACQIFRYLAMLRLSLRTIWNLQGRCFHGRLRARVSRSLFTSTNRARGADLECQDQSLGDWEWSAHLGPSSPTSTNWDDPLYQLNKHSKPLTSPNPGPNLRLLSLLPFLVPVWDFETLETLEMFDTSSSKRDRVEAKELWQMLRTTFTYLDILHIQNIEKCAILYACVCTWITDIHDHTCIVVHLRCVCVCVQTCPTLLVSK